MSSASMATETEIPMGPKPVLERSTAAQIMNPKPRTCSPHSTVTEAVMIFKDEDCGLVPIVEDAKPLGVVTDRDVALALSEYPDLPVRPVSDIMKTSLVTVKPEATIHELTQTLIQNNVRRLLVVDAEGLLAGVISWSDIAPWLSYQMTGLVVAENVTEPTPNKA